jgi:hypothetical protein
MGDHRVIVWGKPYIVTTYKKSKAVWIASGTYMGETHNTEGRSEGAAIKRWHEWAEYKGNG